MSVGSIQGSGKSKESRPPAAWGGNLGGVQKAVEAEGDSIGSGGATRRSPAGARVCFPLPRWRGAALRRSASCSRPQKQTP